jgi:hypothetical protein
MRKCFGVGDGRFVDIGFTGFLSSGSDKFVFMLEVVVGFSNSDVSDVHVWYQRGYGRAVGGRGEDGRYLMIGD